VIDLDEIIIHSSHRGTSAGRARAGVKAAKARGTRAPLWKQQLRAHKAHATKQQQKEPKR